MDIETAELITAVTPFVKSLVEKWMADKFNEGSGWFKRKYKELMVPMSEHFQEYITRSYEKNSFINTLALPNSRRQLKDIYVAQTLIKETPFEKNKKETTKINKLPVKLIKEYKKILITDTAGMGKSTIMKRMFIDLIDNGLDVVGVPIYIELNRLNKNRSLLTMIQEELNSLTESFDNKLLLKFIKAGGFIFFLDGYDEISISDRIEVTNDIKTFISKAGTNNYYILTSRPEDGLANFGDFQLFKIQSLTKKEAFELLRKYDQSNKKALSKKLIGLLESGEYKSIDEYLENPLLTSLLYSAFNHKHAIPLKKHLFYKQVYEAYFDAHDITKGIDAHQKRSGLDIDDFEHILRFVGFRCLKCQKVEFENDELLKIIEEAKDSCTDLEFGASNYLKDLITAVPLFCKDGVYFKWVHKSLQEYFAAQFIYRDSKEKQDDILKAMYNSENIDKYINVLDLYYDIDNWGFKKNILLPLCESYVKYYKKHFFSSNILAKEDIEKRIGLLFLRECCVLQSKKVKISNSDIFVGIQSLFNGYMSSDANFVSRRGDGFYSASYVNPKRRLFSILAKRHSNLVNEEVFARVSYEGSFPVDEVVVIDIHKGEEDRNLYMFLNDFMDSFYVEYFRCFNFTECKRVIDSIKTTMKKKKETSSLVDGL